MGRITTSGRIAGLITTAAAAVLLAGLDRGDTAVMGRITAPGKIIGRIAGVITTAATADFVIAYGRIVVACTTAVIAGLNLSPALALV